MIADEGIEEELVGPVAAGGWAAKGPDVVHDRAEHPWVLILMHECRRRARAPFVDPERRVRCRWIIEDGPDTPIKTLAMLRRHKKRRISVGKPECPMVAKLLWRQRFHRKFGPDDQRPVFVQPERHDRLIYFERVLRRLVGAIVEIRLVTQRQNDATGSGVIRFLGQLGVAQRRRRLRHRLSAPESRHGEARRYAFAHASPFSL